MLRLKELRTQRGWSQFEVGMRFCVPKNPAQVARWERGLCLPTRTSLVELASIFGVPVKELFV